MQRAYFARFTVHRNSAFGHWPVDLKMRFQQWSGETTLYSNTFRMTEKLKIPNYFRARINIVSLTSNSPVQLETHSCIICNNRSTAKYFSPLTDPVSSLTRRNRIWIVWVRVQNEKGKEFTFFFFFVLLKGDASN